MRYHSHQMQKIEKTYALFFNRNECNSKAMDDLLIKIASFPTIMIIVTEIGDKVTYFAVTLTLFCKFWNEFFLESLFCESSCLHELDKYKLKHRVINCCVKHYILFNCYQAIVYVISNT